MNWSVDDNLDDNRDNNCSPNYGNYSPKSLLSCLVTAPARSWQSGGKDSRTVSSAIAFDARSGMNRSTLGWSVWGNERGGGWQRGWQPGRVSGCASACQPDPKTF